MFVVCCVFVADAPEEVLDSGKSLLTFIEAVKKEYDVSSIMKILASSWFY